MLGARPARPRSGRGPARRPFPLGALLVLLLTTADLAAAKKKPKEPPPNPAAIAAQAQELLDAGRAEEALGILTRQLERQPDDPTALFLRSTARFMTGEVTGGRTDLERALALDPKLRQGWLNLGAAAIADGDYERAREAFLAAEGLAPEAPENNLNIGAVELLLGRLSAASERFQAYLGRGEPSADGYYLVATNYALAGYAALAVEHLKRSIELEERSRLRAKTDPNFTPLTSHPAFVELTENDGYRPSPGAYQTSRTFPLPFQAEGRDLLEAVLDALQLSGIPFDPQVEVTPRWAVIWSELRIKVAGDPGQKEATVLLSAPADRFTPGEWQERVRTLMVEIEKHL
jgi:tetratricopeptide (TPR) repeat protein